MANMSYCRFRNTRTDLRDCLDALTDDGIDSLSPEELHAAKQMYILCKDFIAEWEDQNEFDDDPDRYKSEESEREY